jgi:hypothetical protein
LRHPRNHILHSRVSKRTPIKSVMLANDVCKFLKAKPVMGLVARENAVQVEMRHLMRHTLVQLAKGSHHDAAYYDFWFALSPHCIEAECRIVARLR